MIFFPFIVARTFPNIPDFTLKHAFDGVELPVGVFAFPMVGDKEDFEFTEYIRELIGVGIIVLTREGILEFFHRTPELGRKIIRSFNLEERVVSLATELALKGEDKYLTLVVVDIIGNRDAVQVGIIDSIFNTLKDELKIEPIKEMYRLGKDQVVRLRITLIGTRELHNFIIGEIERMATGMGLQCVSLGKADVLRHTPEDVREALLKYLGWTEIDYMNIAEYVPTGRRRSALKVQYGFAPVKILSEKNRKQILEFVSWLKKYARGITKTGKRTNIYYRGAKVEIASLMETELFPFFLASVRLTYLIAMEVTRYVSLRLARRLLSLLLEFENIIATIRLGRHVASIAILVGASVAEFLISIAVFMLLEGLVNYIISQLSESGGEGGG